MSSDWWMYHADPQHTGISLGTAYGSWNVAFLQQALNVALHPPVGQQVLSVPTVVAGKAYVGTANYQDTKGGILYRIDLTTGAIEASFNAPANGPNSKPSWGSGFGGSSAIVNGKLYCATLDGVVYCLDEQTLQENWHTNLLQPDIGHHQYLGNNAPLPGVSPACWTSPLVVNGRVFVGVGNSDFTPIAYGYVYCLDAGNGSVLWLFCTNQVTQQPNVPNKVPQDQPVQGLTPPFSFYPSSPQAKGTSVWSSCAYDPVLDRIYFGTGNPGVNLELPGPWYSDGILSLDASTGTFRGFFQPDNSDRYRPTATSSDRPKDVDLDMPSSPVVYTDSHGRRVVGIGSKCGSYFLLDADSLQILARRQLLPYANGQPIYGIDNSGGDYGVFGTAAVDAALGRLFIPMGGSVDNSSTPFLRAVDWETLEDAWPTHIVSGIVQYAMPDTPLYGGDNPLTAPYSPALANNVVLATKVSANATTIYAFDTTTGSCLWQDVALPTKSNSLGSAIADDLIVLAGNTSLIVYARKLQTGHVYDMAIDQTSGSWVARDLTRATQAPAAVGDPSGYFAQVPRVVYRGQNNHILELSIWPPTGKWIAFDMTAFTGAPVAAGDPAGYYGQVPRVVYRSQDGHIWELSIDLKTDKWIAFDMTVDTNAPLAAGDPMGYFGQVPRVVYRSQNGQIIELSIDPTTSKWIAFNMTATSTAGNPSPYLADTPHVVFVGV